MPLLCPQGVVNKGWDSFELQEIHSAPIHSLFSKTLFFLAEMGLLFPRGLFPLVADSRGYSSMQFVGFSLQWPLLS